MQLAQTDSAFLRGALEPIQTSAPDDVVAYARGGALVLVNARSHAVRVAVTGYDVDGARDLLSDRRQQGDTVALAGYGAMVLER
jgi:hypothetical protein